MKTRKLPFNYKAADTEIVFNDGVWINGEIKPFAGLAEIRMPLPKPPPDDEILGYGLPPEEQYWDNVRPRPSSKLQELIDDESRTREEKIKLLDDNEDYYEDEIKFILQEQKRIREVTWFFNNGKRTPITPDNYFYCSTWEIDGKNPYFCIRDWEFFWSIWLFGETDAIHLGINDPKERRIGDTNKSQACALRRVITIPFFKGGMQSKDRDHAQEIFESLTIVNWDKLPFYIQPIWNLDYRNRSSIKCYSPKFKTSENYRKKALHSMIDYTHAGENALDGLKKNLIINDEIGKTIEADVYERWKIQRPCLMHGGQKLHREENGKLIPCAFAINTSTVEEMEKKGGYNFKRLCDESHYNEPIRKSLNYKGRNKNGRTHSGLVNIFIPANEGFLLERNGYRSIDKYGYNDLPTVTEYLLNERESEKKGKMEDYIAYLRRFPLDWDECWLVNVKDCNFNLAILNQREADIQFLNPKPYRKGNFKWEDGKQDTRVVFVDDEETGRWIISEILPDKMANRVQVLGGKKYPDNWLGYVAGGDPYKYKHSGSKGGGAVFKKRDYGMDAPHIDVDKWRTYNWVCTYSHRHRRQEMYGEDMILMCHYFGCKMASETNVDFLVKHFENRGYENFLHYFLDKDGLVRDQAGKDTDVKVKEELFRILDGFIDMHGMRINHPEILEDCKLLQDDFGAFDRLVACGFALKAAREDEEMIPQNTISKEGGSEVEDFYEPSYVNEKGEYVDAQPMWGRKIGVTDIKGQPIPNDKNFSPFRDDY